MRKRNILPTPLGRLRRDGICGFARHPLLFLFLAFLCGFLFCWLLLIGLGSSSSSSSSLSNTASKAGKVDTTGTTTTQRNGVDMDHTGGSKGRGYSTSTSSPLDQPIVSQTDSKDSCVAHVEARDAAYVDFYQGAEHMRRRHGVLRIAAFCRLWVPPLHNTGGMQYHAYHLYSQLASRGHRVIVYVTGPSSAHRCQTLRYTVDATTLQLAAVPTDEAATLIVRQVPSTKDTAYSAPWMSNCLRAFQEDHEQDPFHVVHSESWAAVPNIFQMGLPFSVTWHGSMLDWFRNEINLIVHDHRMNAESAKKLAALTAPGEAAPNEEELEKLIKKVRNQMPKSSDVNRMKALGGAVAMESYMLLTVPQHIVISDVIERDLENLNLLDPRAVKRIYNGVNPVNFRPRKDAGGEEVRASFLTANNVDSNDFVIGCGGRLEGIKGHHQLSVAMGIALRKYPDVTLLVAGTGSEEYRYRNLRQQLNAEEEALIAEHGRVGEAGNAGSFKRSYRGQVVLVGMLPQEKFARFYQSLDVFIDPFYQHHGLNTVMLEASLSAVPLVVTRLGSSLTTVPCSAYGRTFPLGDAEALAREAVYYKEHVEEKQSVGLRLRERALKLFSSTVMADSYERLFYEMHLNPPTLQNVSGKVVCNEVYPAMCYREPV